MWGGNRPQAEVANSQPGAAKQSFRAWQDRLVLRKASGNRIPVNGIGVLRLPGKGLESLFLFDAHLLANDGGRTPPALVG